MKSQKHWSVLRFSKGWWKKKQEFSSSACELIKEGSSILPTSRLCEEEGIKRQLTTTYTPHENGVAERKNRTVMNMVRCMLIARKVPKTFWTEAVNWTFYVLNRCPTLAVKNITPQEAWSGVKPSVDHFRVWGCVAHVHVPKEKRGKLDDRSFACVFLGVSDESKGYRLFDPKTKRVVVSKDVVFEEEKSWDWALILENK